jgi:hypothetical protein
VRLRRRSHGTGGYLLDAVESGNHAAGRFDLQHGRSLRRRVAVAAHKLPYQRRLRIPAESPHQPFSQREKALNSYTSFAVWASKVVRGTKSFAGLLKYPGVNDP